MPPGLGLPVRVTDRALAFPDNVKVPLPSLWVDRLSHCAQHPEAGPVVLLDLVVSEPHESTNRRRGGVEGGDLVALNQVPVAAVVGVRRDGLEHDCGDTVGEGTVDDVGMTRDPAAVRHTGVDVPRAEAERVFRGHGCVQEVSCCRMGDALRLASGPRGEEDEHEVLAIHPLRWAVGSLCSHEFLHVQVSTFNPVHFGPGAPKDEDLVHVASITRLVHDVLQGQGSPTTLALIRTEDPLGISVLDPVAQCFCGEPREDHRVNGTNPSAGQHHHGKLWDHGHIDGHSVALFDALGLHGICDATDLMMQLEVSDLPLEPRLIALPDDGHLVSLVLEVLVDAGG
mmetsp:Transcript_12076/g.34922  ORF Transcript_12076/g.34922 Transcript_12076/m.34922 type:complete len:341 (-) Transcript_12076:267-1289(-)